MYTILTTFPSHSSGNVGDRLITESALKILTHEKGETQFKIFFRGDDLSEELEAINASRAIIMPGFAIRDPIYPQTYRLVDDLDKIKVPLIPMGAGCKLFPGDFEDIEGSRYSEATASFLRQLSAGVTKFSCREYSTSRTLQNHGISNTLVVGDCAWYDLDSLGQDFRRPKRVRRVVFTTPHNQAYVEQAKSIIDMLACLLADAEKICSFQSTMEAHKHDKELADHAAMRGFQIEHASHSVEKLAFYETCDLHVGYRCHGHIAFLRKRIPSILVHEDGRGIGFSNTLGVGGFDAFYRQRVPPPTSLQIGAQATLTLAMQTLRLGAKRAMPRRRKAMVSSTTPIVTVDMSLASSIQKFLEEELDSKFRRYLGLSQILDDTYNQGMKRFVDSIP